LQHTPTIVHTTSRNRKLPQPRLLPQSTPKK
jgi:hypothetical protein